MGRSGAGGGGSRSGGGGGFHSSGGGHGGFRSGSSSGRSGVGRSGVSSSRSSSYRAPSYSHRPPPPPPPPRHYGHSTHVYHHYGSSGRRSSSSASAVVAVFIIIIILAVLVSVFSGVGGSGNIRPSTIEREKIKSGNGFTTDCIDDDLGWISRKSVMQQGMRKFWDETGVQPYVVLTSEYDSGAYSASEKEAWAKAYFDQYCDQDMFLYVYFDTSNSSVRGDSTYWAGSIASAVMDDEACEIFFDYVDSYWYTFDENDTEGMFSKAFEMTGKNIMKVSTNGWDVMKTVVIFAIVAAGICGIIAVMIIRRKHEAEHAQETVDILQAGQNQQTYGTSSDPSMDDLTSRYDDK